MISNLRISFVELVIWAVFATVGLTWTAARVFDGLERAWDWWRRDRVTPLLGPDEVSGQEMSELCSGCWDDSEHCDGIYDTCNCTCTWPEDWAEQPLPPERSWEEMTTHDLPLIGAVVSGPLDRGWALAVDAHALLHPERERRAPWWEAEHRAAYEAMGFDYPSGLMARVRELTP